MGKNLQKLLTRYHDIVTYLFFGILTTAVNWLVFLPCYNIVGFSASASNAISWLFAAVFAYLTNKPFVFGSRDWSARTVIPEFAGFMGCRAVSGALETFILFVVVDLLHRNGNLWKILTAVLVVFLNYAAGRLLVFRKKT